VETPEVISSTGNTWTLREGERERERERGERNVK